MRMEMKGDEILVGVMKRVREMALQGGSQRPMNKTE
jgi:hypothetical protein